MRQAWNRVILVGIVALLLASAIEAALPRNDSNGPDQGCVSVEFISVKLNQEDLPFVSAELRVTASPATIIAERPAGGDCTITIYPLPKHSWELIARPAGSAVSLTDTSTMQVGLVPDVEGVYRVRFNACPSGCSVNVGGPNVVLSPSSFEIEIEAVHELPVPPATEPSVPDQEATPPALPAVDHCTSTGGSIFLPAWVTTNPWNGTGDYETIEGKVKSSKVSRKDSPFNHGSHDVNVNVVPDPRFERLMLAGREKMEIEWERDFFPEIFRPTRNDRTSVKGYWIYDCSHENRTEIHPPVMSVAHRPRPVRIADSFGLGSNIIVPGVVSHLWINSRAGEVTDCSDTGLHQPYEEGQFLLNPPECIPGPGLTRNPIRTTYEFDIHLPRSPQQILEPIKPVPPVPLFIEITDPRNLSGPTPVITQDAKDPNVLHVSVDLRNFTGLSYSRKILAAWALPSANNWGLKRWRVTVDHLDVHDSADGIFRGEGDWKFWVNINNTEQEWTKVLDCNGCVDDVVTFGGPFRTGATAPPGHRLGPDIELFPSQRIWLMTTGFESDWAWGDATGDVALSLAQRSTVGRRTSHCRSSLTSGCGSYTLHYEISEIASEVPATLTPDGQDLADQYTIELGDVDSNPSAIEILYVRNWGLPSDVVVPPGASPASFELSDFGETQSSEASGLIGVESPGELAEMLHWMQENDPERLERYFSNMRNDAIEGLNGPTASDILADLRALKPSFPEEIWDQYFGDIDLSTP